jgi:hypothetical protein
MAYKIKRENLESLLEQIFGTNWQINYELNCDMLGYALFRKLEGRSVSVFSADSRRLSNKEMYYYLRGLFDMKKYELGRDERLEWNELNLNK